MKKQPLISFHGKQEIKDAHIARLQMHADADEIIQGTYWQNGKGCDTGCSFHSSDHGEWPRQLGIPRVIGKLRDRIFEGLPNANAKLFPLACSSATPVGVDLQNVWRKFMIWLLVDDAEGVIRHAKSENGRQAIKNIADAFERSLATEISSSEWWELRKTARSAAAYAAYAYAAYAAAAYAAYAAAAYAAYAAYAAAAYAADAAAAAAADAAAAAAAYAADAADAYAAAAAAYADADDAADADADDAADAYADAAARKQRIAQAKEKARETKYIKMSEKLIELLKAA